MKLYFVRHGESEANVLREISNRGWRHGLTEKGRQQAAALAVALADSGAVRIYTSPLRRAVETAQILSESLGIPYEQTDALREYDCGIVEGRSDPEGWQEWSRLRSDWFLRTRWDSRIEGGESFLDIRARFVPFIEQLLDETLEPGSSIILIGHGGTYSCMLPLVLTNVSFPFATTQNFPNTGYVLAEKTPKGLYCVNWCGAEPE